MPRVGLAVVGGEASNEPAGCVVASPSRRTRERIRRVITVRGPQLESLARQVTDNAAGIDSEASLVFLEMLVNEALAVLKAAGAPR